MHRTFNCGVGMVISVPADTATNTLKLLQDAGENAWIIGSIAAASEGEERVEVISQEA